MEGNEITNKDIIGWIVILLASLVPLLIFYLNYRKNKEKQKKSDEVQNEKLEKQSKELGEIEKKSSQEIETRVKLERKIEMLENSYTLLEQLHSHAMEDRRKYFDENMKLRSQNSRLRSQLIIEGGIPPEEHDIDDDGQRDEAILAVNRHWKEQGGGGKINGQTQSEVLGKRWEENFNDKKGKDILKERKRLIKLIDETKSEK